MIYIKLDALICIYVLDAPKSSLSDDHVCCLRKWSNMATSAEEAKRAVQKCYPNLLELLPISKLVDRLYSRELLSFDRKSRLDSLTSLEEKIKHFLNVILIPGLNVDYTGHFDEMVDMMKESDDVLFKCLVKKLIPDVSAAPTRLTDELFTNTGKLWDYA